MTFPFRLGILLFFAGMATSVVPSFAEDFYVGVGTHLYHQDPQKNSAMLNQLAVNSFRDDLLWHEVERSRGRFSLPPALQQAVSLAAANKMSPLLILDYGNRLYDNGKKPISPGAVNAFATFSAYAAGVLKKKVYLFEIWNEWDQGPKPRAAGPYLELIRKVAPAIKKANENAVVLAGASSGLGIRNGWVEQLVESGVLKYADGISIHPYMDVTPEAWVASVANFSSRLNQANGGRDVPLYITEMGWPGHTAPPGLPAEVVGQYAARALLLVRTIPAARGFWWYDLKNDGIKADEREDNFGLLNYDYTAKPAFAAYKDVADVVRSGKRFLRLPAPSGLVLMEIEMRNGDRSFAIWTEKGNNVRIVISSITRKGAAPAVLTVGMSRQVSLPVQNVMELSVDGTPRILSGFQAVRVVR